MNHIIGVDGGPSIFGYVDKPGVELNVHYYLNYKPFLFKTHFGITPNTNFGTLTQFYLSIGFTTKMEKYISAHIVYGLGKTWVGREEYMAYDENGERISYGFVYFTPPGINNFVTGGIRIKPKKTKNFLIGLDATISTLGVETHYLFAYSASKGSYFAKAKYIATKPFAFNLVISYKLNKGN